MEAADTALCRFFALIARSAWRIAVFRPDEQGAFLVVVQHSSSVEISPEYPPERDEKADDGGGNRNAATQIHHLALNALGIHVEYVKRASVIVSAGSPVSFVFRGLQSPFLTEVEVAWLRCKVARGTAAAARFDGDRRYKFRFWRAGVSSTSVIGQKQNFSRQSPVVSRLAGG